jgi:hypothetical protein
MAILDLLKASALSLFGQTPKIENQQKSRLEKDFKTQSTLDLDGEIPKSAYRNTAPENQGGF